MGLKNRFSSIGLKYLGLKKLQIPENAFPTTFISNTFVVRSIINKKYILSLYSLINWDFARIQQWCNHWCMILNPNKTKALVVSRSRTVNPPHDDLVLFGVSILASP